MAVAITADPQDVYPTRVLVSVTGLTVGDDIELFRQVAGERTALRGGTVESIADTAFVRTDAELPFGTPVRYVAVVNGTDEYLTSSTTYDLTGGMVALSDAITGLSIEVAIWAWEEKAYQTDSSTFRVGGRNVVVSGEVGGYTGAVEILTEFDSERETMLNLLRNATEGIIQVRQPGGYGGVDAYWAVTAFAERRFFQKGDDPRRLWTLQVVEVEPWAPSLEARGYTYQNLSDNYAGLDYADLGGDYATYLALAQADLS